MCKDCWFSKYNKVLLHYSVSMAAAAVAAAVPYIPLSAAAAAATAVAYIPLSASAAAAAGGGGCCWGGGRRRRISLSQLRIRITAL